MTTVADSRIIRVYATGVFNESQVAGDVRVGQFV